MINYDKGILFTTFILNLHGTHEIHMEKILGLRNTIPLKIFMWVFYLFTFHAFSIDRFRLTTQLEDTSN